MTKKSDDFSLTGIIKEAQEQIKKLGKGQQLDEKLMDNLQKQTEELLVKEAQKKFTDACYVQFATDDKSLSAPYRIYDARNLLIGYMWFDYKTRLFTIVANESSYNGRVS